MLILTVGSREPIWNPNINQFVVATDAVKTYKFEFTLLALSKWESYYQKPFLNKEDKNAEETEYMLNCMEVDGQTIDLSLFTDADFTAVSKYIDDPRTATTITRDNDESSDNFVITSELLYGLMVIAGVPFEAETWHINRLQMLLGVVSHLRKEKKPMSKEKIQMSNYELNEKRKKELGTKG